MGGEKFHFPAKAALIRVQKELNPVQACVNLETTSGCKIDKPSSSDAVAETLAPPEPGRAPRPWPLPFISAAGSLLTASNRPVLHASERLRGVRHPRPFVLERDGGDRRVMRADHLAQVPLPFR